jgi:hypothetical protein
MLLFVPLSLLMAEESLSLPSLPPRSPEGQKTLESFQKHLVAAFGSSQIEKKYLAAHKLAQLTQEELTRDILNAAIESMRVKNFNYRWYISHQLKKISGADHKINIEAWRIWLRMYYRPQRKKVGKGPVGKEVKKALSTAQSSKSEMTSGSWGHDHSGAVLPEDVEEDGQLGHDPLETVVDEKTLRKKKKFFQEGSGSMEGVAVEKIRAEISNEESRKIEKNPAAEKSEEPLDSQGILNKTIDQRKNAKDAPLDYDPGADSKP